MTDDIWERLEKIFLIISFTLVFVHIIVKYVMSNQEKGFSGLLYVVLIVALIGGFETILDVLVALSESMSKLFHHDGERIVEQYFEHLNLTVSELQDDEWYENPFESIGYLMYKAFSFLVTGIDYLAYVIRELCIDVVGFFFPVAFAMSLFESHRGKLPLLFGIAIQITLWSAGWTFFAALADDSVSHVIGNPYDEDIGLTGAIGSCVIWLVWILLYIPFTIIIFKSMYEMGISYASSSLASKTIGSSAQAASTIVRTSSKSSQSSRSAITQGAKAAATGGMSLAQKSINRVRRGGIITPRAPKSKLIT